MGVTCAARGLVLAAFLGLAAASAQAAKLDLDKPADVLTMFRKIQCSTVDKEPVLFHWSGRVYARVPGEADKTLFLVEGMNIRQCVTIEDPQRGRGMRIVSRELMFYLDPATGEILRTWKNPWTGETVDVLHVANDPVNQRPTFAVNEQGKPSLPKPRIEAGRALLSLEVPLFYRNPLAGDYQDYVGNQYHAMEIFNNIMDADDLLDAKKTQTNAALGWTRIAEWLPWMKMGGRPGLMVTNATGLKIPGGIEALPKLMVDEIKANYPIYMTPPPVDDQRPNETSWTYFKKIVDQQRAEAAKAAAGEKK